MAGEANFFPDEIPSITVPLPLPIPVPRQPDLTELTFTFAKITERQYGGGEGPDTMAAAEYEATCEVDTIRSGVLANVKTGKVETALGLIVNSAAKYAALIYAYQKQDPPQPVPPNPGAFSPLSSYALTTLDGTAAYRGFCAGIHSLDPDLVATVDVEFGPLWSKGGRGGGEER